MRFALAILATLFLLGCDEPEKPQKYPILPPQLQFSLRDSATGTNLFPYADRTGLRAGDHVDSVKLFDEDYDPIGLERYRGDSGFYFPGIRFTVVDDEERISETEVARKLYLKINSTSLDSIEILYRFIPDAEGILTSEYVKVFFNTEYVGGTTMSHLHPGVVLIP